jgi:phenylpropionate dioxygenase-like ring-hydroxylating dioxygenase large terminal subunit
VSPPTDFSSPCSYGLNGKLAKAPGFSNEVPGFKNEDHGLLPLRVHKDKNGFIFVNMDQ